MLTGYGWKCDQCFKEIEPKTALCGDCYQKAEDWSDNNWKGYKRRSETLYLKTGNPQTPYVKVTAAEKQHILKWDRTKKKCSEKYGY